MLVMSLKIFKLDGAGGAKKISQYDPKNGLYWIKLNLSDAKEFLTKHKLAKGGVLDFLCATESRPRVFMANDKLVANFRGVNLNPESDPEDMVSVRLMLSENLIISVSRRGVDTLNSIESQFKQATGPISANEFLVRVIRGMTDRSADIVCQMDDKIDDVEDMLEKDSSVVDRKEINELKRKIILLRRYLLPQREAILRLLAEKIAWMDDVTTFKIRDVCDGNIRILEDLDAERERVNNVHELLMSIGQEKMNQKMYILSIVAVIFMPLSFLTGLFGVNLGGIPGSVSKVAFLVFCVLLVILILMQVWFLKRRKWI